MSRKLGYLSHIEWENWRVTQAGLGRKMFGLDISVCRYHGEVQGGNITIKSWKAVLHLSLTGTPGNVFQ